MSRPRWAFQLGATLALVGFLAFLSLPLIAVFTDSPPAELLEALSRPSSIEALWLSLQTAGAALLITILFGTPAAYMLATRRWKPKPLITTMIELPLVLPPAAAGIALLASFGPSGLLGGLLEELGIRLVLETAGVIVALTYVSAPFYLRQAQAAFEAMNPSLMEAARTLGRGETYSFIKVAIPSSITGISAGAALALGRALGEFGATLMFAGSFPGITETTPLAIYALYGSDFPAALALSGVLIAVAFGLLLSVKIFARDDGSHGLLSR